MIETELITPNPTFKEFVGEIVDIFIVPSQTEGVKGKAYALTVKMESEDLFRFYLPIGPKEMEDDTAVEGSILDRFLDEVKIAFPETEDIVTYQEKLQSIKSKKARWVWKPLGPYVYDVPPAKYPVPRKIPVRTENV